MESHLFSALTKLRLIESREVGKSSPLALTSWQTSGYSRCGRTDKGVSALGQVVALRLRSAIPPNSLVKDDETVIEEAPGASPLLSLHPEDQIMCRVKVTGRANKKKKGAGLEQCGAESAELEFENKELAELDYCQMINRSTRSRTIHVSLIPTDACRMKSGSSDGQKSLQSSALGSVQHLEPIAISSSGLSSL